MGISSAICHNRKFCKTLQEKWNKQVTIVPISRTASYNKSSHNINRVSDLHNYFL